MADAEEEVPAEEMAKAAVLESLARGSGRWVHVRDEGYKEWFEAEAQSAVAGMVVSFADAISTPPEHWYVLEGTALTTRIKNPFTPLEGHVDTSELGKKIFKEDLEIPSIGKVTGYQLTTVRGESLEQIMDGTISVDGVTKKSRYTYIKTVNGDEMRNRLINDVAGREGTRIFQRYPWYKIVNKTGKTVRMSTYGTGDFIMMSASTDAEFPPSAEGRYQDAHDPNVAEEQGYFCLPDGRSFTLSSMKVYTTVELTEDMFQ
mmetsp:Transcript_2563/g.7665  ORF Transcript_2563/g.7665 Transcript_2563/m.7665 type:complete len:260 (-) Transcript_2563:27-806(-)